MIRLCVIALLLWPTSLLAKPALVKSGEHENFSRLVIYSGKESSWRETRTDRIIELTFEGLNSGFDLGEVFDFIPRTRVQEAVASEDTLTLSLGCDCDVIVEEIDRVGVLIDVVDAVPKTFEIQVLPKPLATPPSQAKTTAPESVMLLRPERSAAIDAFQKSLIRQVGAAATRNLLTPTSPEARSPEMPEVDVRLKSLPSDRIRTTSAADRAVAANRSAEELAPQDCPAEGLGAVEKWENGTSFSDQLSEIRRSLLDEPGTTNDENALALARLYLAFGMTTEARGIIRSLDRNGKEWDFILMISDILDEKSQDAPKIPVNGCNGSFAIWSLLSSPDFKTLTDSQAKEVSRTFLLLPPHMKELLSSRIVARLKEAGHDLPAEIVRNSSQNLKDPQDSAETLTPLTSMGRDELLALITRKDTKIPGAIVELLDLNWSEKKPLTGDERDLVRSYIFELRHDELVDEMNAGMVRDAILAGRLTEAMDGVDQLADTSFHEDLINDIINATIAAPDDAQLAKLSLRLSSENTVAMASLTQRIDLSQRLNEIGLPDLAARFQERPAVLAETPKIQADPENASPDQASPLAAVSEASIQNARETLRSSEAARASIAGLLSGREAGG